MFWKTKAAFVLLFLVCVLGGCTRRRPTAAPVPLPAPGTTSDNTIRAADTEPPAAAREIAILFNNAAGYAEVAQQLRRLLSPPTYRITMADVEAATSKPLIEALRTRPGLAVVAIGLPAARVARDRFNGPVVFAQVFNYQELLVEGRAIRGVSAMPPLDLQLREWKKLDPKLRSVGLIVSQSHRNVIPPAQEAAQAAAVTLTHEISDSDRATLYLFKRLAPRIDGLWLLPDDRILSPTILRELLAYAVSHGVRVCVFSDALLQWGAFMSATPTPAEVARTLRRVLDGMTSVSSDSQANLVALSEISISINHHVAERLRMALPTTAHSWVVRR